MTFADTDDGPSLVELARYDWVVTASYGSYRDGGRLHALAAFDDDAQAEDQWGGAGTTACGFHSEWLSIPGLFTRMGQKRCRRCCDLTGLPRGEGSPKNDDECRRLLGMPLAKRSRPPGRKT